MPRSGSALTPAAVLAGLNEREQLGSTGFGQGVAIPHAKIDGLTRIYGLFARLGEPVDYKAIDGRPVDLVFLLLSPPDAGAEHLKALAAISRVTRDVATLEKTARRAQPRCPGGGADGRRRAGRRLSRDRAPDARRSRRLLRRVDGRWRISRQ